jgi:hypothetical protein
MTKEPETKQFGDEWPREKLLCYDVRCYVMNTLAHIELLQDSKLNPRDSELVKQMFKQMEAAAKKVEELFQIICKKEKEGTA